MRPRSHSERRAAAKEVIVMRYPTWKRYPTYAWFGVGLLIAVIFFVGAIIVMRMTDDAVNDQQKPQIEDRPDTTLHIDTLPPSSAAPAEESTGMRPGRAVSPVYTLVI